MKNLVIGIGVVLALGVAGYVGYTTLKAPAQNMEGNKGDATVEVDANMPVPGVDVPEMVAVHELTIEGKNFSFSPSTVTVKKGETVRITFVNTGGTHDLVIDEFNVRTKRTAGGSDTVEFVADRAGSFEYYCSVGSHRAMGMVGTLVVSK